MSQVVRTLAGLNYDVIYIHLNLFVNHVMNDGPYISHIVAPTFLRQDGLTLNDIHPKA